MSRLRLRVCGICEILRVLCRGCVVLEGPVLGLVLPRAMSRERSTVAVGGDFLAELEDGHSDGDDEAEEGELEGVPGLETEDTDGERDESHGLEQDEDEDGDDDLLQLGFAGLLDAATLAKLDVESELIVVDVPGAHLHGRLHGQLEGDVMGGQVALDVLQEGSLAASGHLFSGVRVASDFHRLGNLYREESEGELTR